MSNRLLDMFQTQTYGVKPAETCDPLLGGSTSRTSSHVSRLEGPMGRGANKSTRPMETQLERENSRLREQLKFQGAVLDRLAGDVHALERSTTSASMTDRPPWSERDGERGCKPADSGGAVSAVARRTAGHSAAALTTTRQALAQACPNSAGRDEGARLRSELKEARGDAEELRKNLAATRRAAKESEQAHVDLLSRERKFRAAVEAGLREKVHNVRRRARDREERLSSELSAAKAQLKEAMDLLATKEEESCLARAQRAEQEEKTVAAMARLTERDRRARWLERRLIEVSSSEAAATTLRMEEMSISLVNQQRELERLRAAKHNCVEPGEIIHQRSVRTHTPREACVEATSIVPASREVAASAVDTAGNDAYNDGNPLREDHSTQTESEHVCTCATILRGRAELKNVRDYLPKRNANSPLTDEARVLCDKRLGPGVFSTVDVDIQTSDSVASEALPAERSLEILEWLLSPADQPEAMPISTSCAAATCICDETFLQVLRSRILAALAEGASGGVKEGVIGTFAREGGALSMGKNDKDGMERWRLKRLDAGGTRVTAGEEELTIRQEGKRQGNTGDGPREGATVTVQAARQPPDKGAEATEKNGAMLELQEIVFSLRSELSECRGACERYQRELSEERKARRELEKGTESTKAPLPEAVASATKAEPAKTLSKARYATPKRRKQSAGTLALARDTTTARDRSSEHHDIDCAKGEEAVVRGAGTEEELAAVKLSLAQSLAYAVELQDQLQEAQARSGKSRDESLQAIQRAEIRAMELEHAWEALAAKVVSLADRNADLEWAILALRRGRCSTAPSCGCCDPIPSTVVVSAVSAVPALEASNDTKRSRAVMRYYRYADVPHASLNLDSVLEGSGDGEKRETRAEAEEMFEAIS